MPGGPQSVGHYYVANAGSLGADGWASALSSAGKRVRGSIDYSVTPRALASSAATWPTSPRGRRRRFATQTEDLHDVTTSVATDIPETATRVFVFYKINTGYARSDTSHRASGLDARFDVQINQALPFELGGTRWEVLVGFAISSAIRTIRRRSTTSCSSSGRQSASSADSSFASESTRAPAGSGSA